MGGLAAYPGSFDPLTIAHLTIAHLTIAEVAIGKEDRGRDRLDVPDHLTEVSASAVREGRKDSMAPEAREIGAWG